MKKLFTLIMAIMLMTTLFVGCDGKSEPLPDQRLMEKYSLDDSILKNENPFINNNFSFEVAQEITEKGDRFQVSLNGTDEKQLTFAPRSNKPDYFDTTNAEPVENEQVINLYNKSKAKILDYISTSEILVDKDGITEFINNIPLCSIDFKEINGVGIFDDESQTILMNNKEYEHVCEWMFTHELIHAISYYTHGCTPEYEYSYSRFNETMTDLIVSGINYDSAEVSNSIYSINYDLVSPFIGIYEEDAIYGYFYGYHNIIEKMGNRSEMDLWVHSLECLFGIGVLRMPEEKDEDLLFCYQNLIYKWAAL